MFLNNLSKMNRSTYICADFNIDLLKIHKKHNYGNFFDTVLSAGFHPKITLHISYSRRWLELERAREN